MKMVTQQERLKDIIKSDVAPAMKEAGFRKKGNWFSREGEANTDFLNIVSSRWNDKDNVDFTFEMYVMGRDKKPMHDSPIARTRIEHLKEENNWYNLNPDVDSQELGQKIRQDISQYAMPFFERYKSQ